MKILIVDDETSITEIVSFHLQDRGFEVVMANDPLTVRSLMQSQHFDLVAVDYMMPGMNGLDVAKLIRRELKLAIPILMVTGKHITIPLREECLALGVVIYPKPFTGAGLFQKVCDLLAIK